MAPLIQKLKIENNKLEEENKDFSERIEDLMLDVDKEDCNKHNTIRYEVLSLLEKPNQTCTNSKIVASQA